MTTKRYAVSIVLTKIKTNGTMDIGNWVGINSSDSEEEALGRGCLEAQNKTPGFSILLMQVCNIPETNP